MDDIFVVSVGGILYAMVLEFDVSSSIITVSKWVVDMCKCRQFPWSVVLCKCVADACAELDPVRLG